jgi:aldehyde:ferredoxin oxidoreductase
MAKHGYAGEILKVDLSRQKVNRLDTADYAGRFLGGKGIAAKIYWDMVPPRTKAFDPENCLICASGPIAGFPKFASSRWLACGKSAAGNPESFSYGNLGGSWGNRLKYAGYDGIIVQGKADRPVYLFVHDGTVEIRDASHLWGKSAFETSDSLKAELGRAVSVLTIGQAAENLIVFATLLADEGASGSGGMGAVMGSKMLKAIAVAGDKRPVAADPERLQNLADRLGESTKRLVMNFPWVVPGRTRTQACSGCGIGCTRQSYKDENGQRFKSFCQPIDIYSLPAEKYYNGWNEVIFLAMRLCDRYGLDSSVMQAMIEWLILCYQEGVLREEDTGLPLSKIGSPEFIETLTRKIAMREGFGDTLARGTVKAAELIGGRARELISSSVMNRTNEIRDYDPRLMLHNALLIATEPRRPTQQVHEASVVLMGWLDWQGGKEGASLSPEIIRNIANRYWGSAAAADYSSYEGKALAAKKIQDRTYALESLVLCNMRWPRIYSPLTRSSSGDYALVSQIYSAVTGWELDEQELDAIGERIFNLQRAVLLRQGWGAREGDKLLDYHHEEPIAYVRFNPECKVPGRDGEATSRQGMVIDRGKFEKMKSEYYERRGWDVASGLQTRAKLTELRLGDIADDLDKRGLLR